MLFRLFDILSFFDLKVFLPVIELAQYLLVAISLVPPRFVEYPEQLHEITDGQSFDFIVVGGGTAGCVLANRLTEVRNWSILLIEAGDEPPFVVQNPLLSAFTVSKLPDWNYNSQNDGYSSQARRSKTIHHVSGKMLGGSSSINYMYHVRGNKADYDGWADLGNLGWSWGDVEQYFKKVEYVEKSLLSEHRGLDGQIGVTRQSMTHRTNVYLQGFQENGHANIKDYNGEQQMGYSQAQFAIYDEVRQSSVEVYLKTAKYRPNLHVLKNTKGRKVIFDPDKNAIGIEVALSNGKIITFKNRKEVILSAGAVNSPQLLMLSGVGPKEHLNEMGINVVHNSENVGENLEDHMTAHIMITGKEGFTSVINNLDIILTWGAFPIPTLIGFAALNKSQSYPDYQATVCPLPAAHLFSLLSCTQMLELDDKTCRTLVTNSKRMETLQALVGLMHPESKGRIKLKSSNPEDKPLIYNGYFTSDKDLHNFAKYVQDYTSVVNTTTFKRFRAKVVDIGVQQCRQHVFGSHEYWKCYILNTVMSHYHLACTCAMGPEGKGVVDERLRVHGVRGLRVVDASVMPKITSGNTNAPVLMIAEKASDMIKEDHVEKGYA